MKNASFLDFQVDHMTLLIAPELYPVAYLVFRSIFGAAKEDILYEKRKAWSEKEGEVSMTFAVRIGRSQAAPQLSNTIVAVVQPSEPKRQSSHVRKMLEDHKAGAHWQHIALRTPDLLAFHKHALERGVNFITPILKDAEEDLIQTFSGEWYVPGQKPSGMFFEFVQRSPNESLVKKLEEHNRESWFRDKTFLGLYGEKEREYQSGKVTPFIDEELTKELQKLVAGRHIWQLTEADIAASEKLMKQYAKGRPATAVR